METKHITLETLYNLIIDLRSEMNRRFGFVEQRLEHVEERLEHVEQRLAFVEQKLEHVQQVLDYIDKRLEKLENRVNFVENQQMEDRKMLLDIWRNREKVTLTFSKTFAFFNIFLAGVVSSIVAAFVKQN